MYAIRSYYGSSFTLPLGSNDGESMLTDLIILLAKLIVVLVALITGAAYLVLVERKLLGRFQLRPGPNRVGPAGMWQPLADGIKLLLKEDTVPADADRFIFLLAPALVAIVPLMLFVV